MGLFTAVLQMSIAGSYAIAVVVAVRLLLLRKAPKIFAYALWSVVFFRLISPFSFESALSIIPSPETVPTATVLPAQLVSYGNGISGSGGANGGLTGGQEAEAAPVRADAAQEAQLHLTATEAEARLPADWKEAAALVWASGIAVLVFRGARASFRLKTALKTARPAGGCLYEWEGARTPFVFGIFRPIIVLPYTLAPHEREYVVEHEKIHIRRFDHVLKPAAFAVLCLHWFNPLVWLAFRLMDEDMEKSCDEAVIRRLGRGIKKDYSASLLAFAAGSRFPGGSPLAFGEHPTKSRIRNVLNYRKPAFWAILLSATVVAAAIASLAGNQTAARMTEADYAWQYVEQIKTGIEEGPGEGSGIAGMEITRFEEAGRFEGLLEQPVALWRLEYRLELAEPDRYLVPGGMNVENGKITEDSSRGKPVLVFGYENGIPIHLGEVWTGEQNLDVPAGQETALRILFEQEGRLPHETYPGPHGLAIFKLSTGETSHLLLSQPARQGDGGIWTVERWKDGNGYEYYAMPDTELAPVDYYGRLQAEADNGGQAGLLDPFEVAVRYIVDELGQPLDRNELTVDLEAAMAGYGVSPISHYLGYMTGFDDEEGFDFDAVEWLTSADDAERLRGLGIDPENDLPNGFYILNKLPVKDPYTVTENTAYMLLDYADGVRHKSVSAEEFAQYTRRMDEGGLLCRITTQNGAVTAVEEIYLP